MIIISIIGIILNTLVNIWSGSKPFIKVVLKPKTKTRSCIRTTLMNFFDPLQKLTTIFYNINTINIYA